MVLRIATEEYFDSLLRFEKHLPAGKDEIELVLKGHLLIERMLERYFDKHLKNPRALEGVSLSFAHKLAVVAAVHDGYTDSEWLWESARALNKLRNELAHKLESSKYNSLRESFVRLALASPELPDLQPVEEITGQLHRAIFAVHEALSHRVDL